MRIGLIGLGRIGAFHADTFAGLDHVDELVVTDPVAAAVEAVTARTGKARAVADPAAVLADGVDGVVIAAATNAHAELIRAAVDAGIPTFCEKPVAGTIAESLAVEAAVAGSDVP
ncbi:MAG TPA: dehydrogenase, partial [Janibacter terrae]|nr:dehydrogenase [Janibacter terrae]